MHKQKTLLGRLGGWIVDAFPVPEYMAMPAVALDISPNSVKYLSGKYTSTGCLPHIFEEVFLPKGTIVDGAVVDGDALEEALRKLRHLSTTKFTFVAIPENALYLYTLQLAGRPTYRSLMQQVEFSFSEHVPIPLKEAIYDADVVGVTRTSTIVSVTAAPKELIAGYEQVLARAGFVTRSIELEAYSVARSVSVEAVSTGVEMIVDIGYGRAGIIITKNSIPIFSATISGGSKNIDTVVEECKKQYTFWDTRTNQKGKRVERITQVTATGGTGRDLVAPLGKALDREVVLANVWQHLFAIDDYIPAIGADESQAMATLAGLLLKNKA